MELKTENQTNINYNYFFYPTVCHVCKRFGDDVSLRRCSGCKMISYCGKEHQKQHWAEHKTLCRAIQDALRVGLRNTNPNDRWKPKLRLLEIVETKMRSLEMYENQMFMYPNECEVCHEEDAESLVVCQNCLVSFCKDHKDGIAHTDACGALKLYFRLCLSAMEKGDITREDTYMEYSSNTDTKTSNTFQDMNDYINICWNKKKIEEAHSQEIYTLFAAKQSEYVTRQLTLFHAMQVLNYVPNREELVIHVIASNALEDINLMAWELLLHLIETKSLVIILIGKYLISKSRLLSICDGCLSRGKKMSVKFHTVLYQKYVLSPLFVKPDFIVGFNVNIPGTEMTEVSIKVLAKRNCPFVLTSDRQEKLEMYTNKINTILKRTVDCLYSGNNPFASLKPNRRKIGRKLIDYNNNFIAIYRSLCS